MESLVAEELARWDEDAMNSSHSDLGTAHGRPMSGLSLRSRPSTGTSKVCPLTTLYYDDKSNDDLHCVIMPFIHCLSMM